LKKGKVGDSIAYAVIVDSGASKACIGEFCPLVAGAIANGCVIDTDQQSSFGQANGRARSLGVISIGFRASTGPVPGQSTGSFIPQDWHVLAGSHLGPVSSMGELVVDRDWTVHLNAAPKDGRKLPHKHMFINGQQVFPARFGPNRLLYMPATFALTGTTSQMLDALVLQSIHRNSAVCDHLVSALCLDDSSVSPSLPRDKGQGRH